MAKINILDRDTINKIAAGEVVERPSSVVKELIENSIDAGADSISVAITGGGTSMIRITDNGSGIEREDIELAFRKNTTSKIRTAEDLSAVESFGFRGEALSSITSVAKVELITKTQKDFTGIRYYYEGGEKQSVQEVGAPDGTTIVVKDLFFNTPVRRKFLKSDMTEAGYVNDVMERAALANPNVAFKFTNNDKLIINTSGNGKLEEIIYGIYGRGFATELLELSFTVGEFSATGVIAKPIIARGNRNYENYFLNGRYIKNQLINKAIEEAYRTYLMQNKYPFTVINLKIPTDQFDVNVHPAKLEVRFSQPQLIYEFVYQAVISTLHEAELIQKASLEKEEGIKQKPAQPSTAAPEPFELNRKKTEYEKGQKLTGTRNPDICKNQPENLPWNENLNPDENRNMTENLHGNEAPNPDGNRNMAKDLPWNGNQNLVVRELPEYNTEPPKQLSFLSEEALREHHIIGQLFSTYWLVEYDEKLYIIDQHAAHERILFEQLMKSLKANEFPSQQVSPPIVLSLSLREAELLEKCSAYLEHIGYAIEPFGGREYLVSAVPAILERIGKQELLMELLDGISEDTVKGESELIYERIASMSCKAAVKGNFTLSETEAKALINQLLSLENPFHCPHGRPVMIELSKQEIEKKFRRIL